ncbi:hypothetical protein Ddye_029786 [Dipteronia dyeriana]|uniref:Uncharacterized protein n=1 Tax=Dipteronia dyeriana TaxID=168575 RepID=A0AAD9WKW5_9ROSI|nr:hypothetical protein Ddye_029786 [Dipteronia dyeriana]
MMSADEIARLCATRNLKEKEGSVRTLQEELKMAETRMMSSSLVGKVLTNKLVNTEKVSRFGVSNMEWRLRLLPIIFLLFTFKTERTTVKCCRGDHGPLKMHLLSWRSRKKKGDIQRMKFNPVEIGRFRGSIISYVKEVDGGESGVCTRKYLRVQVAIAIE